MVEFNSHNFFSGYNYIESMQTNTSKKYIITGNNIKLDMNNTSRELSNEEKPFIYAIYVIVLKYQSNNYDDYDFQIISLSEDFSAEDAAEAAKYAAAKKATSAASSAANAAENAAFAAEDAAEDAADVAELAANVADSAANAAEYAANAAENAADFVTSEAIVEASKKAKTTAEQAKTTAKQAKNSNNNNDCTRTAVYALYYGSLCIDLINQWEESYN
jgi:hypothetical protein